MRISGRSTDLPRWVYVPAAAGTLFVVVPLLAIALKVDWPNFWSLITSDSSKTALLLSLKTAAAESAPRIVHGALQVVGILGYKNDTPFSLGRQYRDALSASLMISNDRIAAQSASMLLVFKDDQE